MAILISESPISNLSERIRNINYNNVDIDIYQEDLQLIVNINGNIYQIAEVDNVSKAYLFWHYLLNNLVQIK